eukprot:198723_1
MASEESKEVTMDKGVDLSKIYCDKDKKLIPFALQFPTKYIQGAGIINHFGRYLEAINSKNPVVLISDNRKKDLKEKLNSTFLQYNISPTYLRFCGQTSFEEVNQHFDNIQTSKYPVDAVVSIGGGKNIDVGKLLSYKLKVRFVSFPTVASNDSPCSALCIMYHKNNSYRCGLNVLYNPDLVVVDTEIISKAPARFFSCGIGDGMATFYEAKTCYDNPKGVNMLSTNITDTALALAELCAVNLYKYGLKGLQSVKNKTVSMEMEKVCESTILLSGIGFESGGLAAAHAIAQGLSASKYIEDKWYHGEMVSVGVIAHLLMENNLNEAVKCGKFLISVNLPICLNDLGFNIENKKK